MILLYILREISKFNLRFKNVAFINLRIKINSMERNAKYCNSPPVTSDPRFPYVNWSWLIYQCQHIIVESRGEKLTFKILFLKKATTIYMIEFQQSVIQFRFQFNLLPIRKSNIFI